MSLPKRLPWDRAETEWASQIDPVLNNPSNAAIILPNVSLTVGNNTINHKLGRKLQGYRVVRQRGPASIYDAQDQNQRPNLTLVLVTSASVVVDLEVF